MNRRTFAPERSIVTGGASGIGFSIARSLVERGGHVVMADLDPDASLRDGAQLDSMDFLAFVAALSSAIATDIPEDDYAHLDGIDTAIAYLDQRLP